MVMDIRFKRLSEYAIIPTKAYDDDLGLDLYASAADTILPNTSKLISTDVACQFPVKWRGGEWISYGGIIKDRSSISSKYQVYVKAGVIDPPYRGEIKVLMHNFGDKIFHISRGMKIAQMILVESTVVEILEVEELSGSQRNDRGLGSSGI